FGAIRPRSAALKQNFKRPLHRAWAARSDDGVAAIDVRRRADLAEHAAACARAQERAEVHTIGHVEDLPARLNARVSAQLELLQDVQVQRRESRPTAAV